MSAGALLASVVIRCHVVTSRATFQALGAVLELELG